MNKTQTLLGCRKFPRCSRILSGIKENDFGALIKLKRSHAVCLRFSRVTLIKLIQNPHRML